MIRTLAAVATPTALAALAPVAAAQTVRVGVLSDMSSVYADFQGPGSVLAAQMAAGDCAKAGGKLKVEVVSADRQNKPDVGASVARQRLTRRAWTWSSTCRTRRSRSPPPTSPATRTR